MDNAYTRRLYPKWMLNPDYRSWPLVGAEIDILTRLHEPIPEGIEVLFVRAGKDRIVPELSVLRDIDGRPNEHNARFSGIGHMELVTDPRVLNLVHTFAIEVMRRDRQVAAPQPEPLVVPNQRIKLAAV